MTVPQLSKKTNYDNWCLQMKTLLGSQSLWDIVEKGFQEPEEDEDQSVAQIAALEKTRVKDKSALYFLYNAVDESGFEKIANAASSKEAWKILEVAHRGNHRVRQIRLQTLRGEFESLKMEDKEQVSEYITRVEKVANQLGRNGEPMPASRIVEKILRSLTDDFESIACVIEESKDLSVLSVEELAGEEKGKNLLTEEEDEEAGILMMTQSSETKLRPSCASEVQLNLSCVERSTIEPPSSYEKSEAELDSSCLNNSIWYLDTGASNHMCGEESFFNELIKVKAGFVSFGDDSKVAVKGRGTIKFMQKDGRVGEIRNVYYVPELKNNILSMGQMMEKGNSVLMKDRVLYLKDKHDRLIARVEMKKNRMYKLEMNIIQNKCLKLDVKDEAMMRHSRFGHLNIGGLTELSKKELVHGLRGVGYSRTSFPSSSEYKAKEQDIYNSTDELHVVCLLTRTEDIKSEEVVLDERWKKATDEEIGSIEKSEMGSKAELVEEFKEVKREFVMTDLDIMKYFLGLKVDQRATGIFVSQKRHRPPRRRGCWTLHGSRGHGTQRSIALWWKKHRNERRRRNLRLWGSFVG
uniref:Retrovirus-related Pol polyprotein from transposon TNT 1-94 n=1 Tax=Cajanus cajan TaxID=3821 RepID=A0A151SDW4_CAJCA|nr:Retrovirus-related Pol polyprotein from transposon TNT 1-94 [Cajanus cajan]